MFQKGEPAPPPLEPPCEEEIVRHWLDDEIIVSVICPTFQHADYIEDSIKGFVGQKTTFRYEVIIRDDCSIDGTQEIVKKYKEAYPRIIRTIFESVNRWSTVKPFPILLSSAQGKYIATCEGDDYWFDELKLQKQVDFLENNPRVSLLRTRDLSVENGFVLSPLRKGGTRTFMFPSKIEIPEKFLHCCYFADTFLQAVLREKGSFHMLDDVTAVWRKHSGGIFGGLIDNDVEFINLQRSQTNFWIAQYLYEQGEAESARRHMVLSINNMMNANPSDKKVMSTYLYFHLLKSYVKGMVKKIMLRA